jgi:hypothetical protein
MLQTQTESCMGSKECGSARSAAGSAGRRRKLYQSDLLNSGGQGSVHSNLDSNYKKFHVLTRQPDNADISTVTGPDVLIL